MESGPILPCKEPEGAGWTDHGHTGQPAGNGVFLMESAGDGVFLVESVGQCFRAFYRGALPHDSCVYSYGTIRTRERALYLAKEWVVEQHTRQPWIQDIYLVQREACLLEVELLALAKQAWREFCHRLEAQWQQEDDHASAVLGDYTDPSAFGAPMSADLGDHDDPVAMGWISRETDAMERAKAEQRQRVLSQKWDELREIALQQHAEWKSAAEIRAWSGLRIRQPGEEKVLQERLEYVAGGVRG